MIITCRIFDIFFFLLAVDCFSCALKNLDVKSDIPIAPSDIIEIFTAEHLNQKAQGKFEQNFEPSKQEDAFVALVFALQEIVQETGKVS